jgi:hypothetical protein
MPKRVYKFITAQWGMRAIIDRRLKLSTINDFNDPFDMVAIDITRPEIERAVDAVVADFWKSHGILCFSRNWDNLLLWSHYGASHTGLCLGFDIPDSDPPGGYDMEVRYQPNVLPYRAPEDINYALVNRLLRTKHESWSYEQESRLFVKINDPADDKGLHWFYFGQSLQLKEVIVGSQCEPDNLKLIAEALKSCPDVSCSWAYMRKDAFLLIRYDFPPPWFTDKTS